MFLVKFKTILMLLLIPIASIFEMTGEKYIQKVRRYYKEFFDILKM